MKTKQILILVAALTLLLLSELFPPWRYEYEYVPEYRHICPAGYAFITRPPRVKAYDEMLSICGTSEVPLEMITTHKDDWRVNWQRLILSLLSIGIFIRFNARRTRLTRISGDLLVLVSVLVFLAYVALLPFFYF
jgi:hypothetical protein